MNEMAPPRRFANMLPFDQFLEKMPVGAYACDAAGQIIYFNRAAELLWGRKPALNDPRDRFCGAFKLFAADGTPLRHDECWMALALQMGQDFGGEKVIVERSDGKQFTVLSHVNLVHDDAGQLLGAINIVIDITDQVRADEAQARLAAIVESSEDAIVGKTLDGRIFSWNAGAEALFGYREDEVLGRSITLLIPADRQSEETQILERLRQGQRIEHFETKRLTKVGRLIDISLTISPIHDKAGRIIGASKIARDITAQKRTESAVASLTSELATQLRDLQRLHDMSVHLSGILEVSAIEPILNEILRTATAIHGTDLGLLSLTNPDGDFLEIGASLGFDPVVLELLKQVPGGSGACGRCLSDRKRIVVEDIETDPIFAACHEIAYRVGFRSVHSTPLQTRSGTVLGVLSTFQRVPHSPSAREMRLIDLCARQAVDFIENARLYAQLREVDKRKDEFLATLAHELRNPLAPISNSLHIMRLSGDLGPTGESMRGIMERQVSHLTRLVDDLMEVSRITRGRIELRKEPVNLTSIIATSIETCRPLMEASGHQFAVSLHKQPLTVHADPVRLTQVISNLLNNAIKYTPHGGQIWLTMKYENGEAIITVKDTGLGIATHMLTQVFDMFAQVDRTLNRSQGGLGIGLTLARNFVELHGGHITVRSAGLNLGSEFIVTLPAVDSARDPAPTPQRDHTHSQTLPVHRILIVDDLHSSAYTLSRLLEKLGQQVFMTSDPTSALQQIELTNPDIVISDIAMPDMDGHELAQLIRAQGPPGIVLVALTGYSQSSDRARSLAAGFDYHLVKPIGLDELQELIRSLPAPSRLAPAPEA